MPFITGQLCPNLQFAVLSVCRLEPNSLLNNFSGSTNEIKANLKYQSALQAVTNIIL